MVIFISLVKIAHPAHVARGKACAVRETSLQKFCRCDCRAFLRPLVNDLANGVDFVHLWKISGENFRKFAVHGAVIDRFSDVHGFSFLRGRAWDVLLFHYINIVFRAFTRFFSQGLNGRHEARFMEVDFIST